MRVPDPGSISMYVTSLLYSYVYLVVQWGTQRKKVGTGLSPYPGYCVDKNGTHQSAYCICITDLTPLWKDIKSQTFMREYYVAHAMIVTNVSMINRAGKRRYRDFELHANLNV